MATKSAAPSKATKLQGKAPVLRKMPPTLLGSVQPHDDAARKKALELFEAAIKLMNTGKYDKAHEAFTKMLDTAPSDLAASIRSHIAICVAQSQHVTNQFKDPEERYDYAISLLNQGHYDDAREHLQAILQKDRSADYAFYGLALLASMTSDTSKCIENLTEAIRLNAQNRLQARLDSDFENMLNEPLFTELLYPET